MELSKRSTRYLQSHQNVRLKVALENAWTNLYCPLKNPNGVINLSVAENELLQDWLVQKMKENFDLETKDLNYQALDGAIQFKSAMCHVLNQHFNPAIPVKPEHLLCSAGVISIMAQLFYAICDEGDSALISQPYFSGFDLLTKQGINLIGFKIENPLDHHSVFKALEKTYQDRKQVHNIKAVILCNPHNPLGYCASQEILLAYLKFCQNHKLHLFVDEIYGLSAFKKNVSSQSTGFISCLSLNPTQFNFDPSRLHVAYGISKDFGCGGLRAGVLISQYNSNLLESIKNLNLVNSQISSLTASCFVNFIFNKNQIHEKNLLDSYLIENRKQLLESYEYVIERLNSLKIKYNEGAISGFFLMIDLSKYLPISNESDQAKEDICSIKLLTEHKLILSPGMLFHYPKPGFFRLTYTVPRGHLNIALERLAQFVHSFGITHSTTTTTTMPAIQNLKL